jgi:hypothetical protein
VAQERKDESNKFIMWWWVREVKYNFEFQAEDSQPWLLQMH